MANEMASGGARAMRRADIAYEHIKLQLLDGGFSAGAPLPVEQLAGDLSMSRHPVMEAMKRLASEGFVDIIPQVGCRTMGFTAQDIVDHYRLFAATEGLLAELAAERRTDSHVEALVQTNAAIGELVHATGNVASMLEQYRPLNRILHETIHAMSRAPAIIRVARHLSDLADYYISTAAPRLFEAENLYTVHVEHGEIVRLVVAGQATEAGQAMIKHITNFGVRIQDELARSLSHLQDVPVRRQM